MLAEKQNQKASTSKFGGCFKNKIGKRKIHKPCTEELEALQPKKKRAKTNDWGEVMSAGSRDADEQDDDYNHQAADVNDNPEDEVALDEEIGEEQDEYLSDQGIFDDSGNLRKQKEKEAEKPVKVNTKDELLRTKKL